MNRLTAVWQSVTIAPPLAAQVPTILVKVEKKESAHAQQALATRPR